MITIVFLTLGISNIYAVPVNDSKIAGKYTYNPNNGFQGFQFAVSLRDSSQEFFCTGSIVGDSWVLTAAQCGADNVKYVGYGHDFIGMQEVTEVAKTYAHESFDEDTLQNDIMLVRTVKNFPKIPGVHPVDYNTKPQADDYLYNTMVSAGWGQLYSVISTTPNRLEYTIFAMQPQSTCTANNTQSKSELPYNPQFQICARTDRKCNLCFGDVGSPLVVGNVVYGVTSRLMVPNNCARGYPDVFTRVSQYDGWIKRKMSKKN